MRSSKNRSRSKSNRQRSLGNIVNRVFDSSGPEGKVRGTPQQIIDKYLMLARDAQLGNDRVAEQNFLQHAEHYTRMLSEAQREMQREQEARQAQQGGGDNGQNGQNGERQHQRPRQDDRGERDGAGEGAQPDVGLVRQNDGDDGPGLVETPEARHGGRSAQMMPDLPVTQEESGAKPARKPSRGPRKPREKRADGNGDGNSDGDTPPADAAE
jgi:hypothetical protein